MPQGIIKNTGDLPLCIKDPDTGEVYCIFPGYSHPVKTEWPDVREALRDHRRARLVSGKGSGKEA